MKKNARIKTQSALAALAFSLVALNATEQNATQAERSTSSHREAVGTSIRLTQQEVVDKLTQGMSESDKGYVITALGKVDPNLYTAPFIDAVDVLSEGMDASNKAYVIRVVRKVNPGSYNDLIKAVNALSQGRPPYNKRFVIEELVKLNPVDYKDFIKTVNALSEGMSAFDKSVVMLAVGKVNPGSNKDFINTVNTLSEGMSAFDKSQVIEAVGKLKPDRYPFLQNFIRQNPQYFTYVPADQFLRSITPNMTQQQLQAHLERLHREYFNRAPAGTPQALAFEIHNFANQEVVGKTGEKQRFNQAVLNHIESSIEGDALDYNIVLELLSSELATLKNDPLKSDAIDEEVYNWVIKANQDELDKNAIATVVTYLEQKDNTHEKLRTWLYAFMDESKNAYDGRSSKSCMKGVKERVITSLRSAIPEGDSALENLFHQAEAPLMMATKSKKLTDSAFWAEKLQQKGVTSNTPEPQAKIKFNEALVEFFAADKGAQATIDATLDAFDDSESDSDDASDGLWSKIKSELLKIEQDAARQAGAE